MCENFSSNKVPWYNDTAICSGQTFPHNTKKQLPRRASSGGPHRPVKNHLKQTAIGQVYCYGTRGTLRSHGRCYIQSLTVQMSTTKYLFLCAFLFFWKDVILILEVSAQKPQWGEPHFFFYMYICKMEEFYNFKNLDKFLVVNSEFLYLKASKLLLQPGNIQGQVLP